MKTSEHKAIALSLLCAAIVVLCIIPNTSVKVNVEKERHVITEADVSETKPQLQLVDVNSAAAKVIAEGCGIAEWLAEMIVRYRHEYGPFANVDELIYVYGMDKETFEKLRPFVTAGSIYR